MSDLLREAREWINAKLGGIPAPNGGELLARIDANLAAVPPPPAPQPPTDLAVGRDGLQHDAEVSRSSPTPVPLTTEE